MKKVAILGLGNMGRMIASRITPGVAELHLANRTAEKLTGIKADNPVISRADDFRAAAAGADLVFLCVRPQACREVLALVAPSMKKDAHLVSIAADVSIANLETLFGGKVTRMMPTVTMAVDRGVTLLSANGKTRGEDIVELSSFFGAYRSFRVIPEEELEALSIATSCGPGLFAAFLQEFGRSVTRLGVKDYGVIEECVAETVAGLCDLARSKAMSLESIYGQVATKGGITETGTSVLRPRLGELFDEMNAAMMARHAERGATIDGTWK
jgi:pyrroline-5-carboxylate reductase